ncbi:MAG TPA: hypothetical protein VLL04_10620 [Rhizomicrobium sp.]|nr:hypothetical protein [Rhizomicrobium sp.]
MRIPTSLIIAGAAMFGLAGLAPTVAREFDTHTMTVRVPGGGVATIEYAGKVAPKVSFQAVPVAGPWADPFIAQRDFPSFAALDRISAAMDQQIDAMMDQMRAAAPGNLPLYHATLGAPPRGTTAFSIVSETDGACTHVTRITRTADEIKPQIVSQTSGDCSAASHGLSGSPDTAIQQASYPEPSVRTAGRPL